MGNLIRVRIQNVQFEDLDFEMIKDTDKYIYLYSSNDMIEHLANKTDYYGLKCEEYRKDRLMCNYASVSMDPFYDTDIILFSSPERIKETVSNRRYKLQCTPDWVSGRRMICVN